MAFEIHWHPHPVGYQLDKPDTCLTRAKQQCRLFHRTRVTKSLSAKRWQQVVTKKGFEQLIYRIYFFVRGWGWWSPAMKATLPKGFIEQIEAELHAMPDLPNIRYLRRKLVRLQTTLSTARKTENLTPPTLPKKLPHMPRTALVSINGRNCLNQTPLQEAFAKKNTKKILELLNTKQALNLPNFYPLHHAIEEEWTDVALKLIEKGVAVDRRRGKKHALKLAFREENHAVIAAILPHTKENLLPYIEELLAYPTPLLPLFLKHHQGSIDVRQVAATKDPEALNVLLAKGIPFSPELIVDWPPEKQALVEV